MEHDFGAGRAAHLQPCESREVLPHIEDEHSGAGLGDGDRFEHAGFANRAACLGTLPGRTGARSPGRYPTGRQYRPPVSRANWPPAHDMRSGLHRDGCRAFPRRGEAAARRCPGDSPGIRSGDTPPVWHFDAAAHPIHADPISTQTQNTSRVDWFISLLFQLGTASGPNQAAPAEAAKPEVASRGAASIRFRQQSTPRWARQGNV